MGGLKLISRKRNLHRVQDRRNHRENEENRPVQSGKEISILPMHLFEMEFAEKKWRVEIESRQP